MMTLEIKGFLDSESGYVSLIQMLLAGVVNESLKNEIRKR